ncbi:MAG TPA: efflux RND transporter periplasmic adaptor subunit [Terracidiphilus sp.]
MTTSTSAVAAPPRTLRLSGRHVILAGVGVLLLGGVVLAIQQRAVEVQLVSPAYEDIESSVSATGTVTPSNDFPARATFAGIVDRIYIHLGEKVRPGQPLAEMRDQFAASRVENARAALISAELNDENMRMNGTKEERVAEAADLQKARDEQGSAAKALAALQQLRQVGSASDAEVANAIQRLQAANSELQAAQQKAQSRYVAEDLKGAEAKISADKANLAGERVSYTNAHIISPIEGTVYILPVKRYDFVQMGADLLHVADLKKLSVHANFFEPDLKQLRTGEPVRITWTGAPGQTWNGQIQARPMAVTGDGVLRTAECIIAISSDTDSLPVNTSVTVTATVDKHSHVMTLPREAVRDEGSRHYVYRVVGSRLKKTPVDVGLLNALKVEIINGLNSGDHVALRTTGDEKLRNNLRIKTEGNS